MHNTWAEVISDISNFRCQIISIEQTQPSQTTLGIAVRAVMSAGKVISQLLSRGSSDSVPIPRCLWLAHVAL